MSTSMADDQAVEELKRAVAQLRLEFAQDLPHRLGLIEDAAERVRQAPGDATVARALEVLVHKLRGTAGSYGFADVTSAAAEIEQSLIDAREQGRPAPRPVTAALRLASTGVAEWLAGPGARADQATRVEVQHVPPPPLVLVVDPDPQDRFALAHMATACGVFAVTCADAMAARAAARASRPMAAVIDAEIGPDGEAFALAAELRAQLAAPHLPIAFVSRQRSLGSRAGAAQVAGALYLEKPVGSDVFALALRELMPERAPGRGGQGTVLVCDDDPAFARLIAVPLEQAGFEVVVTDDARRTFAALEDRHPDLVLLDVELPDLSGLEVCRVLRATPRWRDIPVMVLTAFAGSSPRLEAFRLGADDFLAKSITGEELVARVVARLRRARSLRERADRDELTGLPTRRALQEQGAARLAAARRQGHPLALALLDLDGLKSLNDRLGHAAGDRALVLVAHALGRALAPEQVRARWGGDELIALFPEAAAGAAEAALAEVRRELAVLCARDGQGAVSFSAGVASYPEDGETLEALLRVADERLYRAKRERAV